MPSGAPEMLCGLGLKLYFSEKLSFLLQMVTKTALECRTPTACAVCLRCMEW